MKNISSGYLRSIPPVAYDISVYCKEESHKAKEEKYFLENTYNLIPVFRYIYCNKNKTKKLVTKHLFYKEEEIGLRTVTAERQKFVERQEKAKKILLYLAPEKEICIGQGGSGMPKSGGYYYGYSTQYCSKQRLQKPFR